MQILPAPAYKRKHYSKHDMRLPLHSETVDRLQETGLSLDDFTVANFKHHLFRCLHILRTFAKIQADQVAEFGQAFFISMREIGIAAGASDKTVKKAFAFIDQAGGINAALEFISWQLRQAAELCSYRSKRNKEILSIASPLQKPVPTIKEQRRQEEIEAVKELKAQISQERANRPVNNRASVRMKAFEALAFCQRKIAPRRWQEVQEKLLRRIKTKMQYKKVNSEQMPASSEQIKPGYSEQSFAVRGQNKFIPPVWTPDPVKPDFAKLRELAKLKPKNT